MENVSRRTFGKLAAGSAAGMALLALPAIEGCSTSWIEDALNDIPTIVGIANSILAIVSLADPGLDPVVAAAITVAATAAQGALTTLQALIADYKASPSDSILTKIDDALTDVQTNLSGILAAGQIKNAALQATIAAGVGLGIILVQAIQALVPASIAASMASSLNVKVLRMNVRSKMNGRVRVMKSVDIAASYNVVAVAAGYGAYQVQ